MAEALSVARETDADVVLMDLSMPVMNGIDATRALVAGVPTVRVIVLTTSTKGQDVHDAAAAGAVGFLSKGADPDDVLDAIRAAGAAAPRGTGARRRSCARPAEPPFGPTCADALTAASSTTRLRNGYPGCNATAIDGRLTVVLPPRRS